MAVSSRVQPLGLRHNGPSVHNVQILMTKVTGARNEAATGPPSGDYINDQLKLPSLNAPGALLPDSKQIEKSF